MTWTGIMMSANPAALTVMDEVYLPGARDDMPVDGTTWKVSRPVPMTPSDPLYGRPRTSAKDMPSCVIQTWPGAAITVTVWAGGFGCPTIFMKVRLCGVTLREVGV